MKQSELMEIIEQAVRKTCKAMTLELESRLNSEQQPQQTRTYYGIAGMAEALGVSKVTAQRWKTQGMLEGGYQQIGNNIIVADASRLRDIAAASTAKAKAKKEKARGRRVRYSIL